MKGEAWLFLESGPGAAAWNMALDEAMLESCAPRGFPVLRWYGWTEPAASFGYSQRHSEVLVRTSLRPLVRRPTGGGIVEHTGEWTYALAFPPGHPWHAVRARESYERVHQWIRDSLAGCGVEAELAPPPLGVGDGCCFSRPERDDVILRDGTKVAGAAQRRNRQGLLIQGSIRAVEGLRRSQFARVFLEVATGFWGCRWMAARHGSGLLERASELEATRYGLEDFTRRR